MPDGSVYFATDVHDSGAIKIGFTAGHPETRLAGIQTGSAYRLKILCAIEGDMDLERRLHEKLAPFRLSGEWFARCKTVLDTVEAAQKGHLNNSNLEPLYGTQGDIIEILEKTLAAARAGEIEGLLIFRTGAKGCEYELGLTSDDPAHPRRLNFMLEEFSYLMKWHEGMMHFRGCDKFDLRKIHGDNEA